MKKDVFKNLKFTYEEFTQAVAYGMTYCSESQNDGIVPEGNIQQFILATIKRSSDEWQKIDPDIIVLDPDGWDRTSKNWKREWYEEQITYQEYVLRRGLSTCHFKKPIEETNYRNKL